MQKFNKHYTFTFFVSKPRLYLENESLLLAEMVLMNLVLEYRSKSAANLCITGKYFVCDFNDCFLNEFIVYFNGYYEYFILLKVYLVFRIRYLDCLN